MATRWNQEDTYSHEGRQDSSKEEHLRVSSSTTTESDERLGESYDDGDVE